VNLYYAVRFDQLESILDGGLVCRTGENDLAPIELVAYSPWAEGSLFLREDQCSVKNLEYDVVVLCVQLISIEDKCVESLKTPGGDVLRYECVDVIDSSDLSIAWAGNIFPLKEFMELFRQYKDQGAISSESMELIECVQWFMMGAEKIKAIFSIIGYHIARHFNELAVLTGFSVEHLRELWYCRMSAERFFVDIKESREEGLVLGMFGSGLSIQQIENRVKWRRQDIEDLLHYRGLLGVSTTE